MNFLDPEEWNGLREMEKEHEVLTEELVKQLHGRLRPYFLRRIKSEVLDLPPKVRPPFQYLLDRFKPALERGYCPSVHDSFTKGSLSVNSQSELRNIEEPDPTCGCQGKSCNNANQHEQHAYATTKVSILILSSSPIY